MIKVAYEIMPNGKVRIRIGRKWTVVNTGAEADAFVAGAKVAHVALWKQIEPILRVTDTNA